MAGKYYNNRGCLVAVLIGAAMCIIGTVLLAGLAYWAHASAQTQAIEKVLAADRNNGQNAKTAADVVKGMEAIDLSGCPQDFQAAYITHTAAWAKMALAIGEADSFGYMIESLAKGIKLDFSPEDRVSDAIRGAKNEISSTWTTVRQVAAKYGANVTEP